MGKVPSSVRHVCLRYVIKRISLIEMWPAVPLAILEPTQAEHVDVPSVATLDATLLLLPADIMAANDVQDPGKSFCQRIELYAK